MGGSGCGADAGGGGFTLGGSGGGGRWWWWNGGRGLGSGWGRGRFTFGWNRWGRRRGGLRSRMLRKSDNCQATPHNRTEMKRTTTTSSMQITPEHRRLLEHRAGEKNWKQWGPFLAERAWGTVREDYSADGSAWDYLPHDHARSKAYRWNEDGLAGI